MPSNLKWLAQRFKPRPRLNPWEWARDNVDYGRERRYETPFKKKFDPDFLPFWKEPAACLTDPTVREIVVLKCSRAGASECVILNPMRYRVARDPLPMLYVGAQEDLTRRYHDERILLGMRLSAETQEQLRQGSSVANIITFPDCNIVSLWPGGKSTAKQFGYADIYGDEVSTWPSYAADMLRKRAGAYRYGHIVLVSSPDPQSDRSSDDDPIFMEYYGDKEKGIGASDQRDWYMPDPKTGEPFKFEFGGKDQPWGIRWDQDAKRSDGSWDLKAVRDTAHYLTPHGTEITNDAKTACVRRGWWVPENKNADPAKRGYYASAPMTPFQSGDLGTIATAFLVAKAKGPDALRVFWYEYWPRKWYGELQRPDVDKIADRKSVYVRGHRFAQDESSKAPHIGKACKVIGMVDVQQSVQFWSAREWVQGGDSGLVDYGIEPRWEIIRERLEKAGSVLNLIDNSYTERRTEVFDQCLSRAMKGAIPCFGRDSLAMLYERKDRDPFEGTPRQGRNKLTMLTWNPTQAKLMLMRLMNGDDPHMWSLPSDVGQEYIEQLTAEEYVDGRWIRKRRDNHYLDCEAMSLVGAIALSVYMYGDLGQYATAPARPARPPRIRGVYQPD